MEGYLTWSALLTFAGAAAAVRYLTEIWKGLFGLSGRSVLIASTLTGIAVTLCAGIATGAKSPEEIFLLVLNGLIVGQAATGLNEQISRVPKPGLNR